MARDILTLQETLRTGLEVTYAAGDSANGHTFDNRGQDIVLHVINGGGAPINVTITTPDTVDGLAIADQVIAVTNAEDRFIGPFRNDLYGQAEQGMTKAVLVDLSDDTSVTLAAIQIGNVNF
jgi:hypothetical protein